MNDWELLQDWAGHRSDAAFAELVRRYLDLVYAAARRQVADPELARDVSQAVFLALAQKAGSLSRQVILGGWLLRTTRFVATRAQRAEQRRQHRETAAALMDSLTSDSPATPDQWTEVEPQLDAALAALSTGDRDLVALRYFERKSMAEVGTRLGIGEDTAKKRVSRALERLRRQFTKCGMILTVSGLAVLLTQLPTNAAPAGLATAITTAVTTQTVPAPVALLSQAALRCWFIAGLRRVLPWAAVLVACLLLTTSQWISTANQPTSVALVETNSPPASEVSPATVATTSPIAPTIPPAAVGASKILLSVRSADANTPLTAKLGIVRFAPHGLIGREGLTTDHNGIAEIPVTEPNIWFVSVWVSAVGYVPVELKWNRHEFVRPVLLQTCRLEPGLPLGGIVIDESGRIVEGAAIEVHYESQNSRDRERIAFSPRLTGVKTDAAGRFSLSQLPVNIEAHGATFVVKHPDYAWQRVPLKSSADARTNYVVTLSAGAMLSGTVTDQNGNPIADAEIGHDSRMPSVSPTESAKTGPAGEFTLGRFRPGTLPIEVSADGYESKRQTIEVSRTNQHVAFTLSASSGDNSSAPKDEIPPTLRITGSVVDDKSGEPIPSFTVRFREPGSSVTGLAGDGYDGRFDWPVHLREIPRFSLEFEASGYAVGVSDLRPTSNGEERFAMRLQRSPEIGGTAVYPDGRPVEGAVVVLNQFENSSWLFDGKLDGGQPTPRTTTDARGHFALKMHPLATRLLIVADGGCSQWTVGQPWQDTLVLQPWGAIEGTVMLQGKPAANETVILWPGVAVEPGGVSGIEQQQTVVTDAEGHFRFERVAASPVRVERVRKRADGSMSTTHRQRLEVQPGKTHQVQLGGTGNTIVGRLELSHPVPGFDWQTDPQYLTAMMDFPPLPQSGPPGTRAHFAYMNEQVRRSELKLRLALALSPDGRFRIEDVPPGEYQLAIRIFTPPTESPAVDPHEQMRVRARRMGRNSGLGGLTNEVTVPINGNDTLDLGTLRVPVRQ